MTCSYCGAELQEEEICPNCGAQVQQEELEITQIPETEELPAECPEPQPQPNMAWFQFLIYLALFAGAAWNIFYGVPMIVGLAYGSESQLIYYILPAMRYLDMGIGIGMVLLAAMAFVVRARLADYCKNGPKLLVAMNISSMLLNVAYLVGIYLIVPTAVTAGAYTNIVFPGVMAAINFIYFKKRADLFQY